MTPGAATEALLERLKLDYQPFREPSIDQKERMGRLIMRAEELAQQMALLCPSPSRELAHALTQLEDAVMWANRAIMRNEPGHP